MNNVFISEESSSINLTWMSLSLRNSRQKEWIVEICIFNTISFESSFLNLYFKLSAALLVNVITKKDSGSTPCFIKCLILSTITVVLPEPGPASTNNVPLPYSITLFWFPLNSIAVPPLSFIY